MKFKKAALFDLGKAVLPVAVLPSVAVLLSARSLVMQDSFLEGQPKASAQRIGGMAKALNYLQTTWRSMGVVNKGGVIEQSLLQEMRRADPYRRWQR